MKKIIKNYKGDLQTKLHLDYIISLHPYNDNSFIAK